MEEIKKEVKSSDGLFGFIHQDRSLFRHHQEENSGGWDMFGKSFEFSASVFETLVFIISQENLTVKEGGGERRRACRIPS